MPRSTGDNCTTTSVDQPSAETSAPQAATVLMPKSTGGNDCTTFEAQSLLTERLSKCCERVEKCHQ